MTPTIITTSGGVQYEVFEIIMAHGKYLLWYHPQPEAADKWVHKIYVNQAIQLIIDQAYFAHFLELTPGYLQVLNLNAGPFKGHKLTTEIFNFVCKKANRKLRSSAINPKCAILTDDDYLSQDAQGMWDNYVTKGLAVLGDCNYYWRLAPSAVAADEVKIRQHLSQGFSFLRKP